MPELSKEEVNLMKRIKIAESIPEVEIDGVLLARLYQHKLIRRGYAMMKRGKSIALIALTQEGRKVLSEHDKVLS